MHCQSFLNGDRRILISTMRLHAPVVRRTGRYQKCAVGSRITKSKIRTMVMIIILASHLSRSSVVLFNP